MDSERKESRVDVGDGKRPIADIFRMLKEWKYAGDVGLKVVADHPQLGPAKSFSSVRGDLNSQAFQIPRIVPASQPVHHSR